MTCLNSCTLFLLPVWSQHYLLYRRVCVSVHQKRALCLIYFQFNADPDNQIKEKVSRLFQERKKSGKHKVPRRFFFNADQIHSESVRSLLGIKAIKVLYCIFSSSGSPMCARCSPGWMCSTHASVYSTHFRSFRAPILHQREAWAWLSSHQSESDRAKSESAVCWEDPSRDALPSERTWIKS